MRPFQILFVVVVINKGIHEDDKSIFAHSSSIARIGSLLVFVQYWNLVEKSHCPILPSIQGMADEGSFFLGH